MQETQIQSATLSKTNPAPHRENLTASEAIAEAAQLNEFWGEMLFSVSHPAWCSPSSVKYCLENPSLLKKFTEGRFHVIQTSLSLLKPPDVPLVVNPVPGAKIGEELPPKQSDRAKSPSITFIEDEVRSKGTKMISKELRERDAFMKSLDEKEAPRYRRLPPKPNGVGPVYEQVASEEDPPLEALFEAKKALQEKTGFGPNTDLFTAIKEAKERGPGWKVGSIHWKEDCSPEDCESMSVNVAAAMMENYFLATLPFSEEKAPPKLMHKYIVRDNNGRLGAFKDSPAEAVAYDPSKKIERIVHLQEVPDSVFVILKCIERGQFIDDEVMDAEHMRSMACEALVALEVDGYQ